MCDAKDLFYRALRDNRFRPILCSLPEVARTATEEDMEALRRAEVLEPGNAVTQVGHDVQGTPVEVTFRGEPVKRDTPR